MSYVKKLMLISTVALLVSGCEQHDKSYSYLVRHPEYLKQQIAACQDGPSNTETQTAYCETVMSAASNFMSLYKEWQEDQEDFGQKVMVAQLDCKKAEAGVQTAMVELQALRDKKADNESIKIAEDKLSLAEKDSEDKRHLVQTMYGVLSLSTPE